MVSHFSLNIPTKPYLKKYIEKLYGDPVVFTTDNYFGMSLAGLLERPVNQAKKVEALQFRCFDKFNQKLQVFCPIKFIKDKRYGFDLSEESIISINKLIEESFEEKLFHYCLAQTDAGKEFKTALEKFCSRYGIEIEEDISYEALKKKEYRFRKNFEKTLAQLSRQKTELFA